MVELKYDKVTSVEIGDIDTAVDTDYTEITNVLYFAERVVSVEGDMVSELSMINDYVPGGVHQYHKYLELELCLDTDWLEDTTNRTTRWAYTRDVDGTGGVAINATGANPNIEYFLVNIREYDGTATTLCYTYDEDLLRNYGVTNVLWCVGETSEFSNEDGTPHQTVTFRFICLQDVHRVSA